MLTDTPICDFGWKAPSFALPDPSGTVYASENLMGKQGLVVAFICNHCPYVKAIIDRLVEDAHQLAQMQISCVAIMSNDYRRYPDDSPERMAEFIAQHNIPFPYLIDENQNVARDYGAVCTPDFFGLNSKAELHYRGRLDDATVSQSQRGTAELIDAMQMMIDTDHGPEHQIPSMGCSIKWRDAV